MTHQSAPKFSDMQSPYKMVEKPIKKQHREQTQLYTQTHRDKHKGTQCIFEHAWQIICQYNNAEQKHCFYLLNMNKDKESTGPNTLPRNYRYLHL